MESACWTLCHGQTGLIRPSVADARGSRKRRRYSYRNLLTLKLVKTLLDNGIKPESVREGFTYLRNQLGEDVSTAKLVIAGTSAVLVRENYELIDVVNRYQGQGVLNLLALDDVKEQVDDAIVELFPAARPRRRRKLLDMLSAVRRLWSVIRPWSRSIGSSRGWLGEPCRRRDAMTWPTPMPSACGCRRCRTTVSRDPPSDIADSRPPAGRPARSRRGFAVVL
jgi:DNA-binding transcriptional MerR regulator